MTVTFEQMQDAVTSARRMREALDCHLGMLDAKAKALSVEGRNIPSDNNFFLYTADPSTGIIRIQQDAAFIVEAVLVVNPQVIAGPLASNVPFFYELSLKDGNAGRDLTGGTHALYAPAVLPVPEEDTNFVPGVLLVPISGTFGDITIPNVDDWKTTKAEYILPRGSVVRALFQKQGTPGSISFPPFPNPDVILAGYKVF